MGLLPTLKPGETARRLIDCISRSSSLRRLLTLRRPSAAEIGPCTPAGGWNCVCGCAVDAAGVCSLVGTAQGNNEPGGADAAVGESILASSLMVDEDPRGKKVGGGGVRCSKLFQKSLLPPLLESCLPNVPKRPLLVKPATGSPSRPIVLSSGIPLRASERLLTAWRVGEECVVSVVSLSRTCRMTSASRLTSASTGIDSSINSSRTRPSARIFG